jgi:hypothetical protein
MMMYTYDMIHNGNAVLMCIELCYCYLYIYSHDSILLFSSPTKRYELKLCTDNDVKGYPTIKYWLNGDEHDYDLGRSFDDLTAFVSNELASKCTFADVDNCSEKGKGYVAKWEKKTDDEKKKEIVRLDSISKTSLKADLKIWVMERKRILRSGIQSDEL